MVKYAMNNYYEDIDNIILGTGSYSTVKKGNKVSIARDEKFKGPRYLKKIAPDEETTISYQQKREFLMKYREQLQINKELQEFKKQMETEFITRYYETKLKNLDVFDLLYSLKKKFGNNIVLVSSESIDEFSPRRILADYIELETGLYIPEVSIDEEEHVKKLLPIRYKNRIIETINKSW